MSEELYGLPLYYDIAFSWDIEPEIAFFGDLFRERVPFPVENGCSSRACGSRAFPCGHAASRIQDDRLRREPEAMLDYAREAGSRQARTSVESCDARASRRCRRPVFPREFDAALNSINSLGYLLK